MFNRIVLLTGMPRSGTSWLSQIFDSCPQVRFRLSPLFCYEFKNYVNEKSPKKDWDYVFRGAYASENEFMNQTERRRAGQYPNFMKKNDNPQVLVIKDTRFHNLTERALELYPDLKVVAIVRHPCGTIHSWLKAPREFPQHEAPLQQWRNGACRKTGFGEFWGFEDWKWVTRLHMRLEKDMPDRLIIQRYEDLVTNPIVETKKLFAFARLDCTDQTEKFLQQSQRSHVLNEYAVFKDPAVKDRWRTELEPEIREAILGEITGTELARFI